MKRGKGQGARGMAHGARGRAKYRALVVGAGNIGAFFDRPGDKKVLTHAHAYKSHPGFEIAGFVDADGKKAARAAKIWGGEAFVSITEAFASGPIDVVSVAVPDAAHYSVLKKLAGYPVRLVFAEKPLTGSLELAREICGLYKKKRIALAVNYTRRFVPEFGAVRKDIVSGKCGRFVTGTGYYGKGLFHNGSHMLDLLRSLLGEAGSVRVIGRDKDFYKNDPSVSAVLRMGGGDLHLMYVPAGAYTIFEADLLFTKARVRITEAGFKIERYFVKENPVFKGYRIMTFSGARATGLGTGILSAAENIYGHLKSRVGLKCDGHEALMTLETCEKIRKGK